MAALDTQYSTMCLEGNMYLRSFYTLLAALVLGSCATTNVTHVTSDTHPYDLVFDKLMRGDEKAVRAHWELTERLGDETAGDWTTELASACRDSLRCGINSYEVQMPSWVKDGCSLSYAYNDTFDQRYLVFQYAVQARERIGPLLALLYSFKHADHFKDAWGRRMEAGGVLTRRIIADIHEFEMRSDLTRINLYSLERLAWLEDRTGYTTIREDNLQISWKMVYYQALLSNERYQRAALIACRYQLGTNAVRAATVMFDEPVYAPERDDVPPYGYTNWQNWRNMIEVWYKPGQACPSNLWTNDAPVPIVARAVEASRYN